MCICCSYLIYKLRYRKYVKKIEVLTNTHTEFDFVDTAADIQRRRERERERGRRQRDNRGRRGEGKKPGGWKLQSHTQRGWPKRPRTERSDSEMDTEAGGKADQSQISIQAQEGIFDEHLFNRLT